MITFIELVRFRGFERLRADLRPHAYIVGPNSAGKSTVLEALALAEQCLRLARRKNPSAMVTHRGRQWLGFPMPSGVGCDDDPVRYEFGRAETRVSVDWANGGRVHMVWPEEADEEASAFFYLEEEEGCQPRTAQATRSLFSPITIVPVVTPLDRFEELKNPTYVETHGNTRLASRHFRNHAWRMNQSGEWEVFREFCRLWLPEISLLDVSFSVNVNRLAVFYAEPGSRVPKELAWAGDGIQIWVQLLWHLFRARAATTIVLDEPEVYLHPDLQRRLVRLLDTLSSQIVLASHSADIIAEAPVQGVLWVDRRIGGARRAKSHQVLSELSTSLGSSFNLALARSMRARLVLATDCDDVRMVRLLAKHVGATNLANEHVVSVVKLREVSRWVRAQQLGDSLREVLPGKLPAVVLLSAGFRPCVINDSITRNLAAPGITVRFLAMNELENYLLDSETVARASGAAPEAIAERLTEIVCGLRNETRSAFIAGWIAGAEEGRESEMLSLAERAFDDIWAQQWRRVHIVSGVEVISQLNGWLESQGYRLVSGYELARAVRPQSLASEVLEFLLEIDDMAR